MQPTAYPVHLEQLRNAWSVFMETGKASSEVVQRLDPAVLQSWRRCIVRLNPQSRAIPTPIARQALSSILRAQSDLITVATPFIEDIHQFVEGSDTAILLADGAACVLVMQGDQPAVVTVNVLGLGQGTYWSEERLGTNALGIVLIEAMPMQVVGPEHYFQRLHHLVTTAAPIHDVRGRITGVLGVVGAVETATSHTLGLVMSAARAIGNQLQADWYLHEANHRLSEVNTILGSIAEGVIVWDESGEIRHVNVQAGHMLQLNPRTAVGRSLGEVLALPPVLADAIAANEELQDVETIIRAKDQTIRCLVTLRPIFQADHEPVSYIALLSPIEHVRQIVQQQVGTQATLTIEDVYGQSSGMRQVVRQARIAARGTAPVLLRGEGGVGKNVLARAIHNDGKRLARPFVDINCRAIPHELMAREILGHEKDMHTQGRPSKFELADGGTLLLDQIESLSLELQAALLQVIETGHVMRLGSAYPIPVDVRIIGATTANLDKLVAEGSFLAHLYYRFGVFNIQIPSLRERQEDIPLLAERFLARITARDNRATWLDDGTLQILYRYPWPGNVRELESALERALHQSQDGVIRPADLPEAIRNGRVLSNNSPQAQPILSFIEAEREAILQAGWACHGQVSEMARMLGIGRSTLWRKMKQLSLTPAHFKQ
jgi:transcriptional activator for dhaKLM operon